MRRKYFQGMLSIAWYLFWDAYACFSPCSSCFRSGAFILFLSFRRLLFGLQKHFAYFSEHLRRCHFDGHAYVWWLLPFRYALFSSAQYLSDAWIIFHIYSKFSPSIILRLSKTFSSLIFALSLIYRTFFLWFIDFQDIIDFSMQQHAFHDPLSRPKSFSRKSRAWYFADALSSGIASCRSRMLFHFLRQAVLLKILLFITLPPSSFRWIAVF